MRPFLRFAQLVTGTAQNHFVPVIDKVLQHLPQRQHPRHAVHQRQVDDPECDLQLSVLVKLVDHHFRLGIALQLDDHPNAVPVGFVTNVGNTVHLFATNQFRGLLDKGGFVHLVGHFADDHVCAVVAGMLHVGPPANDQFAASGAVGLLYAGCAENDTGGREVGAGDVSHKLFHGDIRVVDGSDQGIHHLPEVVRRDVGCHAYRDAGAAVAQQVREDAGKHNRLLQRFIEIGAPVHRVFVQIAKHLARNSRHPDFRISHGRR